MNVYYPVKINGELYYFDGMKKLIIYLFLTLNPRYQPFGLLKRHVDIICDIVVHLCVEYRSKEEVEDKAAYTRMIKKAEVIREIFSKIKTRQRFIESYYNMILAFEGMGLLHNFGLVKTSGGKLRGNPERDSMYLIISQMY
jgi:hypothetical protein